MNRTKKIVALRSKDEGRRAPKTNRSADITERVAIRRTLERHDIDAATKKAIEDLAVEYEPALKRLADR